MMMMKTAILQEQNFDDDAETAPRAAARKTAPRRLPFLSRGLALLAAGFLAVSCDQAPVFFLIQVEQEPKDPVVAGSPSRIVEYGSDLFISNGRLYYSPATTRTSWTPYPYPPPGKRVNAIAATAAHLYTLVDEGGMGLYVLNGTGTMWDSVTAGSGSIAAIYAAGNTLFVSTNAAEPINYSIPDVGSLNFTGIPNGAITAAAQMGGSNYYIAIGEKIYTGTSTSLSAVNMNGASGFVLGFAVPSTNDTLYAVTLNGTLKILNTSPTTVTTFAAHYISPTGAIAIKDTSLLLGRRYSGSYTNGYIEVYTADLIPRGDLPVTVPDATNYATYTGSLGRHIINFLYVHGSEIFASTQQHGLWVLLNGVWTIEDNTGR
jgi:hypothetical protein